MRNKIVSWTRKLVPDSISAPGLDFELGLNFGIDWGWLVFGSRLDSKSPLDFGSLDANSSLGPRLKIVIRY